MTIKRQIFLFNGRMNLQRNENVHTYYFGVAHTDTIVPRNRIIRMKTNILRYPQNKRVFFQQSDDKYSLSQLC